MTAMAASAARYRQGGTVRLAADSVVRAFCHEDLHAA